MRIFQYFSCVVVILALVIVPEVFSKKKAPKEADPKECEVCISNLNAVDALLKGNEKRDKAMIEKALTKHCTLSGFGSEWKPNPNLSQKDVKMCYFFEPFKKSISQPFATGVPKDKVCKRLKKDNPEICDVKYPVKVEKEGEAVNYNKMRVKELKTLLDQRGVKCSGCTEKTDFVKKCQETEHLDII